MSVQFATLSSLESITKSLTRNQALTLESRAASRSASKDTFLSHSSKDARYLPAVIKLLENHGASVYCDLSDERMPETPNPETADIIKSQIKSSRRLVVFVTTNSKDSKWVPWELGIGDAILDPNQVALLPAAQDAWEQTWARQEYLGLYRHIVYGDMKGYQEKLWMVRDYRTNTGTPLVDWCKQ